MSKRKVDEIVSDYTAAKLKNMFSLGPKRSAVDVAAQNIFTKELVGKIAAYLDNGIKTGLIDPKIQTQPATTTPTASSLASAKPPAAAASPAITDGPKPGTPEYFAAQRQQKQAQAAKSAQTSMVPVNKQVTSTVTQAPKPGTPEYFAAKRQAAAAAAQASMVPKPPAPKANILPSPSQQNPYTDRILKNIAASKNVQKEDKFYKLNQLFETIVNLSEAEGISSALEKYVYQVSNINPDFLNQQYKQVISDKIEKIEKSYAIDKGTSELKNLALIIYQIRSLGAGALDQAPPATPGSNVPQTPSQGPGTVSKSQPASAPSQPKAQTMAPTTAPVTKPQQPLLTSKEIENSISSMKTVSLKSLYKHLTGKDFIPT